MGKGKSKGLSLWLARIREGIKKEMEEMGLEYEECRGGPWGAEAMIYYQREARRQMQKPDWWPRNPCIP